ncbi:MAG: hypothetical protein KatS3mg076_2181 [Candidatus Binatia bacterium]|nr:MAG: hypothetical protein KatS3mg076_2181 [Candidatus Binatia bacterium]
MGSESAGTPEVSIVLPIHNQADHLERTVVDYLGVLERLRHSFELLLVVNASRDDSARIARELAARNTHVRVLEDERPGWGRAVLAGFRASRGRLFAYTNSARTNAYTLGLLVLLGLANPGYVWKANRRLRYPFLRRLGSVLYNFECRSLFGLAVWDVNGTPKVLERDVFESLALQEEEDLIDLELVVKCQRRGLQIVEVPVVSTERHGGRSTTTLRSAWRLYRGAFRLWRELGRESA